MRSDAEQLFRLLTEIGRRRTLRDPLWSVVDEVDLTRPQLHAVLWLGVLGPLPASELARRVGTTGPSCTGLVDRLEAIGLVRRARKEGDRRVVLVELTEEGTALSRRMQLGVTERLSRFLGALSPADRKALIGIFGRLVASLEAKEAAASPRGDEPAKSRAKRRATPVASTLPKQRKPRSRAR